MGNRRISAFEGRGWSEQSGLDRAWSGDVSDAVSADQSGGLLARALAKSRRFLQQFARELFGGIARCLPRRGGAPGLARAINSARCNARALKLRLNSPVWRCK